MADESKRRQVAALLAVGVSNAEAARRTGVDRSTVGRWRKEQDFQELVLEIAESAPEELDSFTLSSLIPLAHALLRKGLEGSDVAIGRARIALEVLKVAETASKETAVGDDSFEKRLAELSAAGPESD